MSRLALLLGVSLGLQSSGTYSSAILHSDKITEEDCAADSGLQFLQAQKAYEKAGRARQSAEERKSKPWEEHFYLVGTHHKAGSQLLRNTMRRAFDILGADKSCQEDIAMKSVITSVGGDHKCDLEPNIRIHWNNDFDAESLQSNRKRAGEEGLRAIQIIRDPLVMVASAYCYHHRGMEPGTFWAPENIMEMDYEEGVPAVAVTMLPKIDKMVEAYLLSQDDLYTVRYEDLTRSSEDFDSNVALMFDFMFGGLIAEEEMQQIRVDAQLEDLNRGDNGFSAGQNHSSDDEDMAKAKEALSKIPMPVYEMYQSFQRALGYPVTARSSSD